MIKVVENYVSKTRAKNILSSLTLSPLRTKTSTQPNELGDFHTDMLDDLLFIANKLLKDGYFKELPNAATINEYLPGQSIHKHIDDETYGDVVAVVSLMGKGDMQFDKEGEESKTFSLSEFSVVVFDEIERWQWTHTILPVQERRVSIVFRRQKPNF